MAFQITPRFNGFWTPFYFMFSTNKITSIFWFTYLLCQVFFRSMNANVPGLCVRAGLIAPFLSTRYKNNEYSQTFICTYTRLTQNPCYPT